MAGMIVQPREDLGTHPERRDPDEVADVEIHEHGGNRYGVITFEDVMVHSSNVGAARKKNIG